MKSYVILKKASLLFLLFPVIFLVTCNKDDSENSGNGYRITKVITNLEGIITDSTVIVSTLYEYEGDKISLQHHFQDGQEIARTQIDYPDNNTIETVLLAYNDSSWNNYNKRVYKLEGNHVVEATYYYYYNAGESWEETGTETFDYENDNMIEFNSYFLEHGILVPVSKSVDEFIGHQLIQTTAYDYFHEEWQETQKSMITYNGSQIDTLFGYDYEDGSFILDSKVAFTYEGDLIKDCTGYSNDNGSWEENGIILYTYDSYDNLISAISQDGGSTNTVEYFYEKGVGNYIQLTLPGYEDYGFYFEIFPHPTKANKGGRKGLHPSISDYFGL